METQRPFPKGPGKNYRKGLSLVELTDRFLKDQAAEDWFIEHRWPLGVTCPYCDSDRVRPRKHRKFLPFRCGSCKKDVSVKTNTVMHASDIGFRTWLLAIYLMTTGIKGVSSMKLHRDLGITQKSAWHLAHRIREAWSQKAGHFPFSDEDEGGAVEVDETNNGGKESNKHKSKKLNQGRGAVGKTAVVGIKDRTSNQVSAKKVRRTDAETLHRFIKENVKSGSQVYTDDHRSYHGLADYQHQSVKHSAKEFVDGMAHTNGIESFWAGFKREFYGTYHHFSVKHLDRYVSEFVGRHNHRPLDTSCQMELIAVSMDGKRLRYRDLV